MTRIYCWGIAIATVLAGMTGCDEKSGPREEPRVMRIVSAQPRQMEFVQKIRVQGNVESCSTADISSRTGGNIDFIKVDEGSKVKAGELLFEIDRCKLENDVKAQEKKVEVAQADLRMADINKELCGTVSEKARIDFERARKLKASDAVSDDAFERAKLNYEEALSGVAKAQAQRNYNAAKVQQEEALLAVTRKSLDDSIVRAPFDGTVTVKSKDPNEFVSVGEKILTLEDLDRLQVVSSISSVYYHQVEPGKTIALILPGGKEKPLELPVTFRSPAVDSLSRTFTVKVALPHNSPMVNGQLCDMILILRKVKGVGVPNEALLSRANDRKELFVVSPENTAEPVTVETGIVDGEWTMLLDPAVLGGRPVVIEGQAFLAKGDKLEESLKKGE